MTISTMLGYSENTICGVTASDLFHVFVYCSLVMSAIYSCLLLLFVFLYHRIPRCSRIISFFIMAIVVLGLFLVPSYLYGPIGTMMFLYEERYGMAFNLPRCLSLFIWGFCAVVAIIVIFRYMVISKGNVLDTFNCVLAIILCAVLGVLSIVPILFVLGRMSV